MLLRYFLLAALCLSGPAYLYAQATVCADSNSQRNCCGATTIAECPLIGCGGDAELNTKKNNTSLPAEADIEASTIRKFANFLFPASWVSGTQRTLLESWGEGKALQIRGYLIKAENYTSGAETTNCSLKTSDFNDFHLVMVQFPSAARKALVKMASDKKSTQEAGKAAFKAAEKRSMTAEISPRLRNDGWTIAKLRDLARNVTYVRVTGWALIDTQHISHPLNRLSNWEIHPVTSFEVCTLDVDACDAGDGWVKLEDMPEP